MQQNPLLRQALPLVLSVVILMLQGGFAVPEESSGDRSKRAQHLKPFNSLIGEWRGVGQLQRGSRKGAWTEKLVCEWQFSDAATSVVLKSADSQQFEELQLTWDSATQQLLLNRKTAAGVLQFRGPAPEKWPATLRLESVPDDDGVAYRCTIRQLSDIRATLLFEKQTSPNGSFRRVAEIGYTRAGTQLAQVGAGQRKCVVTGGLGTIPVSHQGKTYYVCCQGCVQAFNDDPEAVLADYRAGLSKP